jgi:hypothetical protein
MYGTIRKNYSARRASNVSDNVVERSYKEKIKKEKRRNTDNLQQTRYMKVDYSNTAVINTKETPVYSEPKKIFKNEFPIASVILTIVVTMMAMVFAFGF